MSAPVDILCVTYNNPTYLNPCLESLSQCLHIGLANLIVVNNGHPDSVRVESPAVTVLQAGKNLGWEGGLKLGLAHSKAPFVCFLNDDTYFPFSSCLWLNHLLQHFRDPSVAATGPSCNNIRGAQNIWSKSVWPVFEVTYLIGLCLLMRRDYLDQAGGVDDTLPGGDDIDLSIRLRKLGKKLICDRNVFVYHHLSTTGRRVRSDWDSIQHQEAYNKALWEKHTLKELLYTYNSQVLTGSPWEKVAEDPEPALVRKYVQGDKVYELGCGDKHTMNVPGIDIVERGHPMGGVLNRISDADIVANVFEPLPFKEADCLIARHILEHTENPLRAILNWKASLKHGGRLVIAVPNEESGWTIPLNPEHKSSFTKASLKQLMEYVGMKTLALEDSGNPISFVGCFEKNGN